MPLRVDLGGVEAFLWALVAASDSRLQQRIDKQYAAYKAHKRQEDRYFDLGARCLDLKQMRQINKEDKTKWRQLEWQEPAASSSTKREDEDEDDEFGDMFGPMGAADDDEGIVIDINEMCDDLCNQSADCRKDHLCPGTQKGCCDARRVKRGTPHRVARSGFGQTAGGKRLKLCKVSNAATQARVAPYAAARREANADKRAEEASVPGFDVKAVALQEIAKAKAAYERALAGFDQELVDVYVFGASTGSKGFSLEEEAVHTLFVANGNNKPILRSSKWSSKKPDMCLIPNDERFSINDEDHVFLLADGDWRGQSGKELAHRIEKALHIFGEQHAEKAGGRIKPLWRGHGKGYPQGIGPYKVGLLVIERDAAGRLPFGWKRTDRK